MFTSATASGSVLSKSTPKKNTRYFPYCMIERSTLYPALMVSICHLEKVDITAHTILKYNFMPKKSQNLGSNIF